MIDEVTGTGRCYGKEMDWGRGGMRISKKPFTVKIMIDQKQLENVKYFNYLGSGINDARCTPEIKSRITMVKVAFNRKKTLFTSKLDLNLRKKLLKCYI
jgi:hypothetical protein